MKLTKKLFIAIMTMALLVVTFGASTFAWFTLGDEAKIENVQVNVTAGMGMEISEDAKSWKNKISLSDALTEAIDYIALSTYQDNGEGVKLYDDKGNQVTFKTTLENGEKNYFFEKVFYVRITKNSAGVADYDGVYLTNVTGEHETPLALSATEGEATASAADQWQADATFAGDNNKSYTEGRYYSFDALNAVKISFTANAKTAANVLFGYENEYNQGIVATDGGSFNYADEKVYEIVRPVKTAASGTPGEDGYVAAVYYDVPTTYISNADLETTNSESQTVPAYEDENKVLTYASDNTNEFMSGADLISTFAPTGVTTLDENYLYAKITVRVWLEGWDTDCINAILGQATVISFKLQAHKENQ